MIDRETDRIELLVSETKESFHFGFDAEFIERIAEAPGKAPHPPMAMSKDPVFQGVSQEQDIDALNLTRGKQALVARFTLGEVKVAKTTFIEHLFEGQP